LSAHKDVRMTQAQELRRAFDASFAAQPAEQALDAAVDFLVVRMGGEAYAMRLAQIRGLVVDGRITRVPSASPELLGLAWMRDTIVPVYSLAALLGRPETAAVSCLFLAGKSDLVGFACERFEAELSARPEDLVSAAEEPSRGEWRRGAVRSGQELLPVIDIPCLIDELVNRNQSDAQLRSARNLE
jgi:chemotaxis signal transduction protein